MWMWDVMGCGEKRCGDAVMRWWMFVDDVSELEGVMEVERCGFVCVVFVVYVWEVVGRV